ncbi:MAG: ATP-binding cassette domain-containing protein [Acidobacteria bacterium]|nr:MAG: ATP-binding cassette domain-containing protein [Acidobacteriota bacterium]
MIEIEDLYKVYGQVHAVRGISFTVHRGEILGFLGPNGAGKSTTMKVMTGLTPPTSGRVRIAGHDVLENPIAVRREIGYLPEHPPLYPEMTVTDYLDFAAAIRGVPRRRRGAAIASAVERCGLGEVRRRLVGNLSKGFRQRVGLAQAVIHDPRLLILDEPTVGLDPTQVIEIRSIVREIGQERTVILSSHILPEVQATCQRVVIIDRGRVVAEGPIDRLLAAGRGGRLFVRLRRPPERADELAALPGVSGADALGDGAFSLAAPPDDDARERLVAELVARGWGPVEVRPETTSLEEVFKEVVTTERAQTEAVA